MKKGKILFWVVLGIIFIFSLNLFAGEPLSFEERGKAQEATTTNQDKSGPQPEYKNEGPNVHGWAAAKARWLITNPDLFNELEIYFFGGGTVWSTVECPDDYYNEVPQAWKDSSAEWGSSILEGTWEEDKDWYGLGYPSAYHFWDPNVDYDTGLIYQSALVKAEYWWKEAIDYYLNDKNYSYYCLGRVVHLLGDMGVPEHVHLDAHVLSTDISNYEVYTARHFNYWVGSSIVENCTPSEFIGQIDLIC